MIRKGVVIGERSRREGDGRLAARRTPAAPRRRVWPRAVAGIAAAAALGTLSWWLLTAPLFSVTRVESGPYRFAPEREVAVRLAGVLGQNLWSLSAGELRAHLSGLPWIAASQVRRRLPGTVIVDFQERRPLLNLAAPRGAVDAARLVVLADGAVAAWPDELPLPDLPFLDGSRVARDGDGWRLESPEPARVVALIAAVAESGLECGSPVDFVVAEGEELSLILRGSRQRILLGEDNFRGRLERYLVLEDRLEDADAVDLRFRDRVLCRGTHNEQRERS